jgi:peptide/nickel transport system substrate-binding protein
VAVPVDVGPLNIFANSNSAMNELVYDQLLAPSPYVADPKPWLAKSVTAVDPSTWELTLREDVVWHDGERFTADDVGFTMGYFKVAPSGTYTHHVSDVPTISQVEILGEHAIRLRCGFPCPDLARITLAFIPILPEHVWKDVTEQTKHTELPVGTGPYRLVDYSTSGGYRFQANDRYFGGRPQVDELVMPIIDDPSTTFTALRTGEIDAAARPVAPELLEDFSGRSDIKVANTAPLQFLEVRLNHQRAPFNVAEFRRGLAMAVDRQEVLDRVYLGQGRPGTQGYPHPDSPWTKPGLSMPFNRQEAASVLDQAGFRVTGSGGVRTSPDGKPLAFTVKVNGAEPTHVRAAQLVVEHLKAVGITAEVITLDAGAVSALFKTRDFDLSVATIGAHGVADPTQFIMSHRSGYLWDPKTPYPEWDALFTEWKATTTIESRTPVLFRMQELFNRQPTSIPLVYPDENWAFRPEAFDGWVESPSYGIVHKWSFLPKDAGRQVNAISQEF